MKETTFLKSYGPYILAIVGVVGTNLLTAGVYQEKITRLESSVQSQIALNSEIIQRLARLEAKLEYLEIKK